MLKAEDKKEFKKELFKHILQFILIITGLSTIFTVIKATHWFWKYRKVLVYYSLEKGKELEDKIFGDKNERM